MDYNKSKNIEYLLIMIITLIGLFILLESNSNFFYWSHWKAVFLILLIFSYCYIINLIKDNRHEIYFLIYMVLLGSILVLLSNNLLITYLGLELQTFSLFILIAKNKISVRSSEAGLKYFILGAISSGFLLISITTIYGSFNSLNINILNTLYLYDFKFIILIIILTLSLFFKLSLFPLHFWIPDIYEGSSTEVLGVLATLPKISIISMIIQLNLPFEILLWSSIFSIIIGSLGGLNQTKIKRLLGYSGISHIGFSILGVSLFSKLGLETSLLYFTIYIIGILGVLILIQSLYFSKDKFISELSGIGIKNITLGIIWSLLIMSMAGLPPLSGFLSKWWIILTIVNYNYLFISILIVLFSAISVGYYLRITKILYFQSKSSYTIWNQILKPKKFSSINNLYLALIFYFTLFLIINPSFIVNLINYSLLNIF